MRRVVVGVLIFVLSGPVLAADSSLALVPDANRASLEILPGRQGYAFEQPEILVRQRLFGLAHGVSLLAAACLDLPGHSAPIQDAYARWHAKQAKAIETLVLDLARYYFGSRADRSGWRDLVRALNLNDSIQGSLGQVSLQEACASLPAAMARPRYQLDKLLALSGMPSRAAAQTAEVDAAVSPAAAKPAGILPAFSCCAVDSPAPSQPEPEQ